MDWNKMEEDALNENLLKTLIKISKTDGEIAESELVYILKAGIALGLEEETIKKLWQSPSEDLIVPSDEQGRMTILYYLIFLVEVDQKLDKKEEDIIYHYGLKLGFNHLMITDFLDVVKAKLSDETKVMNLLEQVKKYLN